VRNESIVYPKADGVVTRIVQEYQDSQKAQHNFNDSTALQCSCVSKSLNVSASNEPCCIDFHAFQKVLSVMDILAYMRNSVLQGCHIFLSPSLDFSGHYCQDKLQSLANAFGATFTNQLERGVTHFLGLDTQADAALAAEVRKVSSSAHVVHHEWLVSSLRRWSRLSEASYPLIIFSCDELENVEYGQVGAKSTSYPLTSNIGSDKIMRNNGILEAFLDGLSCEHLGLGEDEFTDIFLDRDDTESLDVTFDADLSELSQPPSVKRLLKAAEWFSESPVDSNASMDGALGAKDVEGLVYMNDVTSMNSVLLLDVTKEETTQLKDQLRVIFSRFD